jgi:hypothetical protein
VLFLDMKDRILLSRMGPDGRVAVTTSVAAWENLAAALPP